MEAVKLWMFAFVILLGALPVSSQLYINEVMASNDATMADDDGDFEDWIEIYNNGSTAAGLDGYYLSDDLGEPMKYALPNVTVSAKGFLLIWASDKDRPGPPVHTNFKIGAGGEEVVLTSPANVTVDVFDPVGMSTDESYGSFPDSSDNVQRLDPTPGSANEELAAAMVISHDAGFYPSAISVDITLAPGHTALYTINSSNPVNGTPVTGPILIEKRNDTPTPRALNPNSSIWPFTKPTRTDKATILRIMEYDDTGAEVGEEINTYFIGMNASEFSVPVFSIVKDPELWDSYEEGILIKGKAWDDHQAAEPGASENNPFHPANWNSEELEEDKESHYEMLVDGSVESEDFTEFYGSGNHGTAIAQKGFKISYDDDVGPSDTDYPFFGPESVPRTEKVRLRSGSQDWSESQIRDCLAAEIFEDEDIEVMNCAQAVMFLNGEYWGSYNLREDINHDYLGFKYGVDNDDIVVLEKNGLVDSGESGDEDPYFELLDWLETHDLSDQANYDHFKSQMNPESIIDYYTCHMFANNLDFPNDHKIWRNKNPATQVPGTPNDGRWQFFCKDIDQGFGRYPPGTPDTNSLNEYLFEEDGWDVIFLQKAFENHGFRELFFNRSHEMLDTILLPNNTIAELDEIQAEKAPEIARQTERWGKPVSEGVWNDWIDDIRAWLTDRHHYYSLHLELINSTNMTNSTNSTNSTNTTPVCGNGIVESGEACDDSNLVDGDGCGSSCTVEAGGCFSKVADMPVTCTDAITSDTTSGGCRIIICGGKQVKACDKGDHFVLYNQGGPDSVEICVANLCMTNWGYLQSDPVPICLGPAPVCGNSIVESGEECEDGNTVDGDGCSSTCTIEVSPPVCGDGAVEGTEECDDGNTIDGDGCSATCTIESTPPVCGDGVVEGAEECEDGNTIDGDGCSATCTIEAASCFDTVADAPVTCSGTITSDTGTSCREILCGGKQVLACDKGDHFEMYNQGGPDSVEICFGDTCMTNWGFRSGSYTC